MKLVIVIDVDESIDPILVDPHEVAENCLDDPIEMRGIRSCPSFQFVAAEWIDNASNLQHIWGQ